MCVRARTQKLQVCTRKPINRQKLDRLRLDRQTETERRRQRLRRCKRLSSTVSCLTHTVPLCIFNSLSATGRTFSVCAILEYQKDCFPQRTLKQTFWSIWPLFLRPIRHESNNRRGPFSIFYTTMRSHNSKNPATKQIPEQGEHRSHFQTVTKQDAKNNRPTSLFLSLSLSLFLVVCLSPCLCLSSVKSECTITSHEDVTRQSCLSTQKSTPSHSHQTCHLRIYCSLAFTGFVRVERPPQSFFKCPHCPKTDAEIKAAR